MVEFDTDKFIKAFMEAKVMAYITKSTDLKKQAKLEMLQAKMEEVMHLVDEIVGDEK